MSLLLFFCSFPLNFFKETKKQEMLLNCGDFCFFRKATATPLHTEDTLKRAEGEKDCLLSEKILFFEFVCLSYESFIISMFAKHLCETFVYSLIWF